MACSNTKGSRVGMREADGRPLTGLDDVYFQSGAYVISVVTEFPAAKLGSDQKLKQAFQRSIQTSPLLQTRVVGNGDAALFRKIDSEDDWPSLQLITADDDESARKIAQEEATRRTVVLRSGGPESQRTSVETTIVRGKTIVMFAIVAPHHFLDGVGIGSFHLKIVVYARVPRIMWPMVDRLSKDKTVPTYSEMALKDDFYTLDQNSVDGSLCDYRYDPKNFKYIGYDFTEPDA
jgi:hypothetical protein